MSDLMEDIISTAESFAKNFTDKGNFDFSRESLRDVNSILEEIGDFVFDDEALYNYYTMVGSYIFEVARRNYGGKYYWLEEEQQPILVAGEPDYSVSIKAWDKAKKYIENGADEDILFYIDGFKEHVEKGKSNKGYRVVII
jgi:hypothetical protein